MDGPAGRVAYRAVRDILVRHRDDYDAAVTAFRWPSGSTRGRENYCEPNDLTDAYHYR
jgi:hypothetical protein